MEANATVYFVPVIGLRDNNNFGNKLHAYNILIKVNVLGTNRVLANGLIIYTLLHGGYKCRIVNQISVVFLEKN